MSDTRQGANAGPEVNLRLGADELEQRAMKLLEEVGQNSESAYLVGFVDDMRAGADKIERLERERSASAIRALQGEVVASYLKPMFRWVHGRCYFDGHGYSEQHGMVVLNEQGTASLAALDDIPLWRTDA